MPHQPDPQTPGVADHAARRSDATDRARRTFLQGLGVDVALGVSLVVYEAVSAAQPDWRLLGVTVAKTALMTGAAYVMRRLKPPAST